MRHANFEVGVFGGRDPCAYFGSRCPQKVAMVQLDRALVSFYKLSIITMLLTEAVWPQFTMQVFGGGVLTVTPFGEMGGRKKSESVPQACDMGSTF